MGRMVLALAAGLGLWPAMAAAQFDTARGEALQRESRLRELQQLEQDTRLRANPEVPPGQRAYIDYGGYVSFDYLSIDDSAHNNHGVRDYELVGYLRANLDGANEIFLRGRTLYRDYNPGDSFDQFGSRLINPDLDRGYYRFDLRRFREAYGMGATPFNVTVELGRDFDYWGNGLVLGQVLDGGRFTFGADNLALEALAGITPTRTVDIDTSRPNFDHNTRRLFTGAILGKQTGDFRPFVYGLVQRDLNKFDRSVVGPINTEYDYNSYYIGGGVTGAMGDHLRYGVEATYEGGDTLSNSFMLSSLGGVIPVAQTRDNIRAWAFDTRVDWLVNDPHDTRFSGELIIASGDRDRANSTNTFNGNTPGSPDRAFNSFGLINTGLAFNPNVSNLDAVRVGASTYPLADKALFRRLQFGTDFFVYSKFYHRGGINEPTGSGKFLGVEPDFDLNWQIASDVTLVFRYGIFLPSQSNFPIKQDRQFFFGGITFAF